MAAREEEKRRREEAVDWLLRNQAAAGSEAPAFQRWIEADPQNREAYEKAQALMGDARSAILSDPALKGLEPRAARKPLPKVVAGLGLFLALSAAFYAFDGPMRLRADMIAGRGELPVVTLPDGSVMQLNARSAVALDFAPGVRTVRLLRGEAFFQVAPDPAPPFTVEAGSGRTVALGTAFNIRLDGEDGAEVTVTEHAVRVTAGDAGLEVGEGKETSYSADGALGPVRSADTAAALAWRQGLLVVDNATLASVVDEIARYYRGRIVILGSALAERRVSGTFRISDPEVALSVLQQSLRLNVTRAGPLAIIR